MSEKGAQGWNQVCSRTAADPQECTFCSLSDSLLVLVFNPADFESPAVFGFSLPF
jgi:hypothetical protein